MQMRQRLSTASSFPAYPEVSSSPFRAMIVTDLSFMGPLGDPGVAKPTLSNLSSLESWTPWDAIQMLF